jgi:hypothetical protein
LAASEFLGAFLPDERQVTPAGFSAAWRIPHLARSVPEAWSLAETGLERLQPHAFGVALIDPVDFYSLVNRAAKYGILFVALAFNGGVLPGDRLAAAGASGAVPVHRHRARILLRAPAVAGGAPGVRPSLSRGLDGDRGDARHLCRCGDVQLAHEDW